MTRENSASPRTNLELAQKCLLAIRDNADRAVRSLDPEIMGYAIQELTQVLLERTGNDERLFEPVSVEKTTNDFSNRFPSNRSTTCLSCMRNWALWMDPRKTWSPAPTNELCESYGLDAGGAELGMECMTRAARQCTDAMALGVAQNSRSEE